MARTPRRDRRTATTRALAEHVRLRSDRAVRREMTAMRAAALPATPPNSAATSPLTRLCGPLARRRRSRRGCENRKHQQTSLAGVSHAMRHAVRGHQQVAGLHWELAALKLEDALAVEDVVQLIHPDVGVERVRLARLESAQIGRA